MCDKIKSIKLLYSPEEITYWLELQERLHREIIEAMRIPEEFFDENKK